MKKLLFLLALLPLLVTAQDTQLEVDCGAALQVVATPSEGFRFVRWTDGETDNPRLVTAMDNLTFSAIFEKIENNDIIVEDGETEDLDDGDDASTVIVEPGGNLNINASTITIGALIITADGIHSGQVHHHGNNITADHIYLEYILNPFGTTASPNKWYAFAVPFEVDIDGGISRTCDDKTLVSGTDFLIMEYNGLLRALQGKGWEKKLTGTLEPGRFYMLGIDGNCNRWRFEKTGSTFEGLISQQLQAFGADNAANNPLNIGWNSLGNTRLEYSGLTNLSSSLSDLLYAVTYDNRFGKYETHLLSGLDLFVGQPFFIQTSYDGTFDFHCNGPSFLPALRSPKAPTPMMHFTLHDEESTDHLFITLHEEAETTYTIGRDVLRMSADCKTAAQLWCLNAEGTQLTAHGVAEPLTETIVPLGLFAPTKGEYLLGLDACQLDDYTVELLHNDAYVGTFFTGKTLTIDLNKGDNTGYVLRISRKAPNGFENVQSNHEQGTKAIIDGHLYILQSGRIYDAQGKKIK